MATEQLRLVDGTIVRKCPTIKLLYCSRAGKFYSLHNAILTNDGWVLREVKPNFSPAMRTPGRHCFNGKRGCVYPIMRQYDKQLCHKLIALTWIGPRPFAVAPDGTTIPMQIDHLNGNVFDWSADNLEYVTPAENRKRAKYLRVLRQVCPLHAQTFQREDYLEWFKMPFEEFKASLTSGLGELVGPEQMMKESFYDKE